MLGSPAGSPPTGTGTNAPMFRIPKHMLPMSGLMQRQSGQRASPLLGPSLLHQHWDEVLPCEESFLSMLCKMENTTRPAPSTPPASTAWGGKTS